MRTNCERGDIVFLLEILCLKPRPISVRTTGDSTETSRKIVEFAGFFASGPLLSVLKKE
jgi:hypothetical protein